jgi:hypothetical protein
MEAMCSLEIFVYFHGTARRYILQDIIPHSHCCENIKSSNEFFMFDVVKQYCGGLVCLFWVVEVYVFKAIVT